MVKSEDSGILQSRIQTPALLYSDFEPGQVASTLLASISSSVKHLNLFTVVGLKKLI